MTAEPTRTETLADLLAHLRREERDALTAAAGCRTDGNVAGITHWMAVAAEYQRWADALDAALAEREKDSGGPVG